MKSALIFILACVLIAAVSCQTRARYTDVLTDAEIQELKSGYKNYSVDSRFGVSFAFKGRCKHQRSKFRKNKYLLAIYFLATQKELKTFVQI